MILFAKQRDEDVRMDDVSVYDPEMLVFVDENGADRRNILRNKGYSFRNKPAKSHKLQCRGKHISVIAAISAKDCKIPHESVNGDIFYNFVLTHLVPFLQPFSGHNIQDVCNHFR